MRSVLSRSRYRDVRRPVHVSHTATENYLPAALAGQMP